VPLWIPEQMSAFAFHAISLERRGWALCSRHPNFVNDRFGESEAGLRTTRLGRFLPFAPGDRPNDGSRRIGDQIRANSALR
jgi:hypothetical protein